jgi:hypothetical protein
VPSHLVGSVLQLSFYTSCPIALHYLQNRHVSACHRFTMSQEAVWPRTSIYTQILHIPSKWLGKQEDALKQYCNSSNADNYKTSGLLKKPDRIHEKKKKKRKRLMLCLAICLCKCRIATNVSAHGRIHCVQHMITPFPVRYSPTVRLLARTLLSSKDIEGVRLKYWWY